MEKKVTLLIITLLIVLSGFSKTRLFAIYNPEFHIGMQNRDADAFQKFIFEASKDTTKKFYLCSGETELLRIMEAADGVMFFNTYDWDSVFSDGFYYRFEKFVEKGDRSIFLASSYPTGRWAEFFKMERSGAIEYAILGARTVNEYADIIMEGSNVTSPFAVEEFMPTMDMDSINQPILVSDKEIPLATCSDNDSLRVFWSTFGYNYSHYYRWEVNTHLYGGLDWVFYKDKEYNFCKLHIDSLDTTQSAIVIAEIETRIPVTGIILKKTEGDFIQLSRGYESIYDSSDRYFRFIEGVITDPIEYQLILELQNGSTVESNVLQVSPK